MNKIGVAISTTGDSHRLGFLETCVARWRAVLHEVNGFTTDLPIFVTIDGDEQAVERVIGAVGYEPVAFYRVGQPNHRGGRSPLVDGRLGVAANKNTGLELLMDWCGSRGYPAVEHLFLSDDDTYPLRVAALSNHIGGPAHSMVNWGGHRLVRSNREWSWPRGSVLYARREVLVAVGGMIEEFGLGGHEHVEWSRRIHQAGLTPSEFPSPSYTTQHRGLGAARMWHAEDMPKPGEPLGNLRLRRRKITSVQRPEGYWTNAEAIMTRMDGNPAFVSFRAQGNGRSSATLYHNN